MVVLLRVMGEAPMLAREGEARMKRPRAKTSRRLHIKAAALQKHFLGASYRLATVQPRAAWRRTSFEDFMQASLIRPLSRPFSMPRPIVPGHRDSPTAGALLIARSMLWMLRCRARRHDARKFTA
ncbi:MAG: hypothetical protein LBI48_04650 [Burkholderiaceae bacterium]|nr:hypothetical protein [Burkholderiaceae bacterium]